MGVVQVAARAQEPTHLHVFAGVGLDHAHSGQALLQRRQRRADAVADEEVCPVGVALELDAAHDDERQHHEADEKQLPRHEREHHDREQQQQGVAHEHEQARLYELGHGVDVGRHATDDHARLLAVVERHRQSLQVVEHAHAQVAQEPLADETDEHDLGAIDEVGGNGDTDVRHDRSIERGAALADDAVVDGVLDEERTGQDGERPQRHQHRGRHHLAAVRVQHRQRPAQNVRGLLAIELVLLVDRRHEEHQTDTSSDSTEPWASSSGCAAMAAASTSR